jgi:hypothetical protein
MQHNSHPQKSRDPHHKKNSAYLIHRLTNLPVTTNSYNKELKYIRTLAEDNSFNNRTVNKLLRKYKNKQNTTSALETQKDNTNNNWISFTYTRNETTKLTNIFKQIDKSIKIGLKTSNKMNNIIGNSIENQNKFEKRGVYKLKYNRCNKFYIGMKKEISEPDLMNTGGTSPHLRGSLHSLNMY